jgi:hypothetical protein
MNASTAGLYIRGQNAIKNKDIQIGNSFCETVEQSKYLGTVLMDRNSIQEEINRRLELRNSCYHSVLNLVSSRLLTENTIKIYRNIVLPVVLYGCTTWSPTLTVLRKITGLKRDEVTGMC